jgi:two-component system, OmpR family, response regulator ChvI
MKRSLEDFSCNPDVDFDLSIFDLASEEISFLDRSLNCCVCFVDMVNSTKITTGISNSQKIRQYYSIFINTMAVLAKNYGAKIIKNAGDALIFYFPETSDSSNEVALKDMLECITTMTLARDIINAKMHSENLPSVSYRISADYGRVELASSTSSKSEDLFGSTMNICAKINSMAEPNGIVIGGDLYQIMKPFPFIDEYQFREVGGGYSIGFSHRYPVYTALSKNKAGININSINHLFRSNNKTPAIDNIISKQQSKLQQRQQKNSANILAVDDDPDTLFTYKCLLSAEGYDVEAFTDPQKALKHLVQLPDPSSYYQLVLLDIRMPGLNGLQLFYRIKAISRNTKVIFCSALDIAEELVSILPDIKYDQIIKKPVKREYFVSKIDSMLNNSTVHFDSLSA